MTICKACGRDETCPGCAAAASGDAGYSEAQPAEPFRPEDRTKWIWPEFKDSQSTLVIPTDEALNHMVTLVDTADDMRDLATFYRGVAAGVDEAADMLDDLT